ncbi:MAG: hypothetical protein K5864_04350 [Bacteroidales bacterium]|nr:hypothetical protein [Bacteroidales bacterium]
MKNRIITIICVTVAALALSGCSTMTYHAASHDIALLEKKGDFVASASMSLEETPLEYLSASYALSNHWALQSSCALETFKPYAFQQAVGYYTHLGGGIGEAYAGFDYMHKLMPERNAIETRMGVYLQCDYGWNGLWNGKLDVGLGLRNNYCLGRNPVLEDEQIEGPAYNAILLDPIVMIRLGGEHLKLEANIMYNFVVASKVANMDCVPEKEHPVTLTLGVNYRF